ncbi:hypothetical protein CC1G_06367 [Coprinopsis cinerea okayama7|uniref:Uncharacterized protein n=1 Tax=Coprinopsis cinerea (strain Okayama-7 / 130 / ATCC MYA-4618 / FGSC 9003) TaxID=240176 RepID=A8NTQ8_COPC7|nr:hypothetical protein CC1G_06367 [Coprinopsis cinerea okayama7\|eukprot:XP_001836282.2 hypothetical protein CC1G_06367 [Coprinopsis cinerea okayama7\
MALHGPPPVAGSVSKGSFRDTRVADDFSPFGSVHEFNAATRQMAPSPFLHGVRPGSLHTSVAHATPVHRGIDQTLTRKNSMESFYVDPPVGRSLPHPDDVFSDHGDFQQGSAQTPHGPLQGIPLNRSHGGASPSLGMTEMNHAMPLHSRVPEDDENSVRYGSLYGAPYQDQTPASTTHDMHKSSFLTTGSKLSRSSKLTKRSGFSVRRKPPKEPSFHESSPARGTPYLHARSQPSIISERSSRPTSVLSANQLTPHQGTPYIHPRDRAPSFSERPTRPTSIRSIPKNPGTFPFEQDGDDLVAHVWLPWIDRLNDVPCFFNVKGIHGEEYWLEVDYQLTKMIHGTVKFHGGGMPRSGAKGRGRLIVEWEIAFLDDSDSGSEPYG